MVREDRGVMRVKALRRVPVLRQTREQKLTQVEAGTVRGLTTRHIRRLLKRMAPAGDQGLAHRGRADGGRREADRAVAPLVPRAWRSFPWPKSLGVRSRRPWRIRGANGGGHFIHRTCLRWEEEALSTVA